MSLELMECEDIKTYFDDLCEECCEDEEFINNLRDDDFDY